ncbi:hypothetical protein DsansV1_C25g0187711 [Dioscorea sansibarensis]
MYTDDVIYVLCWQVSVLSLRVSVVFYVVFIASVHENYVIFLMTWFKWMMCKSTFARIV